MYNKLIRRIRTLPENENSDRRLNILNNLTDTRTNLTDMNRRRLNIIIFNRTANNAEINRYIQQLNNIENEYQSNSNENTLSEYEYFEGDRRNYREIYVNRDNRPANNNRYIQELNIENEYQSNSENENALSEYFETFVK
jgi:hypothetical protein